MSDPGKRRYSPFPKTIGDCIEPLTRPVFKTQGLAGTRIITDWAKIVGPAMAARCIPQKLSFPQQKTVGGTLTIAVESGFATELQHLQPMILDRLATYFGYKAVSRIVISHTLPKPAAEPKPAKPVSKLPEGCAAYADSVEDEELKKALQSFAHTLSGQKT